MGKCYVLAELGFVEHAIPFVEGDGAEQQTPFILERYTRE